MSWRVVSWFSGDAPCPKRGEGTGQEWKATVVPRLWGWQGSRLLCAAPPAPPTRATTWVCPPVKRTLGDGAIIVWGRIWNDEFAPSYTPSKMVSTLLASFAGVIVAVLRAGMHHTGQKRLDRRLEEVAKAVGGGECR